MELFNLIGVVFVILGLIVLIIAAIGALRLPDFYTRSHAVGVMDTLGVLLMSVGIIFMTGLKLLSAKLVLLVGFIFLANPTITHILIRAAKKSGLKPSK